MQTINLYKRLLSYVSPDYGYLFTAVLGLVVYSSVDATFTYLVQPLLNRGFVERDLHFLRIIPSMIVGLFTLRGLASLIANYCMTRVSRLVVSRIRMAVFEKFLHLPASFYERNSSGQLLSTVIYNADQLATTCTDVSSGFIQSGSLLVGLIVVMAMTQWRLTLLILFLFPLLGWLMRVVSKRMRSLNHAIQRSVAVLNHIAQEVLDAFDVVRVYGSQRYEANKFAQALQDNQRQELKVALTHSLGALCMQMTAALMLALTISLAAMPKSIFALSAGGFVSMMAAMLAMLKPMRDLSKVNAVLQRGLAAAQNIFELLDQPSERTQFTQVFPAKRCQGRIEFRNVSFAYQGADKPVFSQLNLSVNSAEQIALVGSSGSGKSTLFKLLLGFYQPDEGAIYLDGMDIQTLPLLWLRTQFSLVSQHITLFNDTVANNIAYGDTSALSLSNIEQAARVAHAMEFIEKLPEGLQTVIGENGFRLSGGQRQRLAIARAVYKNAPVLLLDEATAALDAHSERLIQQAMQELMRGRTSLVIAHRLATVVNASQILVFEHGQIREQGTSEQLLAQGGLYAQLHAIQFSEAGMV